MLLHDLLFRLRTLMRRPAAENELNHELRFHLERKTGGLTRVLERGRNAIETIVRMVLLQLAPTIVEFALIVAVLLLHFDWRYVAAVSATVVFYMLFT